MREGGKEGRREGGTAVKEWKERRRLFTVSEK
jgi:hypothetical protein